VPDDRRTDFRWPRTLIALAVAAMGVVNVLSALLSHPPERLAALGRLVPTHVLDTSRTFTLLAGALLLVTATGLRRGKRRAFVLALFLCAVSVPVNLVKALDVEEATVAAALMLALGLTAEAFRVKSRELSGAALRSRIMWALLALIVYAAVGLWAVGTIYDVDPAPGRAFGEVAWWLFGVGRPVPIVEGPLSHGAQRVVEWYLRSLPLLSVALTAGAMLAAFRPALHRRRHRVDVERVAALLKEHGDSTVGSFALADDSEHFFSANGRAVIAYRFESDVLLTIGDPIGPPEERLPLLRDFESFCRERDWQFAVFQARDEYLPLYRELGWRAVHIGEDTVIHADRFTLEGSAIGEVRRAVKKNDAAGIEARLFLPDTSPFDPARDPDGLLPELREISNEWLHARKGGEKGFCMGRFDPARLGEVFLAVAWNREARRAEAFLTWEPIPARRGWALDLMRRRHDSAPGVMEMLVARSVEAARGRGDTVMSLALSALASVEGGAARSAGAPEPATPPEADRAREFIAQHLARFYDFKGLFLWKKKFDPSFEDRWLIVPSALALPKVALAIARAQSPGGLLSYLRRADSAGGESERKNAAVTAPMPR
jgi:phosphatidylglycerol lysyltransferase